MNSLCLAVFFASAVSQVGAEPPPEIPVDDRLATVTVEVPARIKKSYALIDRLDTVETNKPVELAPGKHEIAVLAPGYYDLFLDVDLKPGEVKKLRVKTMLPGTSTLEGISPSAGAVVGYNWLNDWGPTDIHPWSIDGGRAIVDGNPLPGAKGMMIRPHANYRSAEFVYQFSYSIERGAGLVTLTYNGKPLSQTTGRHTIILYAAQTGSYLVIDMARVPITKPNMDVWIKWSKPNTSARIVFQDFAFVDLAAAKKAQVQ